MSDIILSATTGLSPTAKLYLNNTFVVTVEMEEIDSTGEYFCDMPVGSLPGTYLVIFYDGTEKLTSSILYWDGTKEINNQEISESLIKIKTKVDKNLTKTQYLGLS
jgi:hypothetical protein